MRRLSILFLFLGLLAGCATRTSLSSRPEALLASLYQEGSVLVSVDAESEPALVLAAVGDERLARRISRVSHLLAQDHYPLDEHAGKTILVEGDFPSVAIGFVMGSMEGYEKRKGGYWQGAAYAVGLLEKNLLLVTDGSWLEEAERIRMLPLAWDPLIGSVLLSPIGVYAKRPVTFFPLQADLTEALLSSIDTVTAGCRRANGSMTSDVSILMADEKKAEALGKILRSGYVRQLRASGQAVDVAKLRTMFTLNGNLLTMRQIELPDVDLQMLQVAF